MESKLDTLKGSPDSNSKIKVPTSGNAKPKTVPIKAYRKVLAPGIQLLNLDEASPGNL
jgi:hypothetical protein